MQFGIEDIRILDVIDVLVVLYLMYILYKLIRGTAAVNIFLGAIVFYFLYWTVDILELRLLKLLLGSFVSIGLLILVIIFQPELRRFLLMLGDSTVSNNVGLKFLEKLFNDKSKDNSDYDNTAGIVTDVVSELSKTKTGSLIIISKSDLLEIIHSGTLIDGKLSVPLLESIFFKNSALHDGAVIIHNSKILAAGCILPISQNRDIPQEMGLRHRAAIGISESSDVLSIVVSEETGELSTAIGGTWKSKLHSLEIKRMIINFLST